ncbi:MAG TPA: 50S ribosomal protein L25 [Gaiellaceae bacterium]
MAGERVKLLVSERTKLGSSESRRLRRQGLIPGILYGREKPVAIAIGARDLRAALSTKGGSHAVLDVAVDGGSEHSAILKEFQRDRVRGQITHVDLQEVRLDQPIHASVAITLVGDALGVKEGGVLSHVTTELHVEALPLEVPQHIDADVSELHIGGAVRVGDLGVPSGVTVLDDPETVVATVTMPTREVEPEPVEGEEGEAAAEGAPPEGAEAGAEPAAEGGEPAAESEAS